MKIEFEDGSFIMLDMTNDPNKLNFIMCGLKDQRSLTMSSSKLSREQVEAVVKFLESWLGQSKIST